MVRYLVTAFTLVLAGILLSVNTARSTTKVTIIFTTKNDGTLEDCGCAYDCQGGLPERMTLIKQLREDIGQFILVDGGNFFTTMGRQRKDEYVIRAYESFEYDAYFQEFQLLTKRTGPGARGLPFFGTTYCRQCHVLEYDKWKKSGHARAFLSLLKSPKAINAECISCHSTGIITGNSTSDSTLAPDYQNVQCEACHIYNVNKIDPSIETHPAAVSETTCRKCHTQQRSPRFNFKRYWKKIKH